MDFKKEVNDKDPKFKTGDHSLLVKLKVLCHGHIFLMILMVKRLLVLFMKMNCKRLSKMNLG